MTIDISGIPGRSIQDAGNSSNLTATNNSNQNAAATTSANNGNDRVSLTSSAMQLRALEERIAELPVVDVQKVSDVQRALATGTLEINEADAADNLLEIERSFSA